MFTPEAASTPGKFENAPLFLRLGLPSTLTPYENEAFRKRSSNRRNLKTTAYRFRVDGKQFEDGAFRKQWRRDIHEISQIRQIQNGRRLLCF